VSDACSISPGDRGVGYLLAEDGLPVRLRTFYLDDAQLTTIAARARDQRRQPPAALDDAAGMSA
jgi:hypothetical protein